MVSSRKQKELLRKVRKIEIVSRKVVNELLGGEYKSVFKGRGMEFDEVREYQPGDEMRTIDWNVTARVGRPFVKRYIEEREQAMYFLLDLSASGTFNSLGHQSKNETAAELCGILAFSAIQNNDKVGLIIFTQEVELFIPAEKGQQHVLHIIREILSFEPQHAGTNLTCALDTLGRMVKRSCIAFLISDFLDSGYEKALKQAAFHFDLIAVTIADPRELTLPNAGLIELRDAETGEQRLIDSSSAAARKRFRVTAEARRTALHRVFTQHDIDHIDIQTHLDPIRDLVRFFRTRERRQTL